MNFLFSSIKMTSNLIKYPNVSHHCMHLTNKIQRKKSNRNQMFSNTFNMRQRTMVLKWQHLENDSTSNCQMNVAFVRQSFVFVCVFSLYIHLS